MKAYAAGQATGSKLCAREKGLCFAVKYNSVQIDFFQNKKSNCSSGFDLSGEKSDDMTSIFRKFKPAGGLTVVVSLRCMLMQ